MIIFFVGTRMLVKENNLCKRYSGSDSGVCFEDDNCNTICIRNENAVLGDCAFDDNSYENTVDNWKGLVCYCYYNCWYVYSIIV